MTHHFPKDKHSTRKGGRYAYKHQQARAAAARRHDPTDRCTRCHHPLGPMGPWLHYDHTDDGTDYLGFAHGSRPCPLCGRRCNIQAGAEEGARRAAATTHNRHPPPTHRRTRWTSRDW